MMHSMFLPSGRNRRGNNDKCPDVERIKNTLASFLLSMAKRLKKRRTKAVTSITPELVALISSQWLTKDYHVIVVIVNRLNWVTWYMVDTGCWKSFMLAKGKVKSKQCWSAGNICGRVYAMTSGTVWVRHLQLLADHCKTFCPSPSPLW